jgi:hypothetical protein
MIKAHYHKMRVLLLEEEEVLGEKVGVSFWSDVHDGLLSPKDYAEKMK